MPKVFGWQHLTYLAVFLAVAVPFLTIVKLKIKSERTQNIIAKVLGAILLVFIIWNRFAIADFKNNWLLVIPDSICGVMSVALGITLIACKRDSIFYHYLVYIAFFGGLANVFYPYYVAQDANFMLPATISGLLHHSVALVSSVYMVLTGYFKPSTKKFYAFPLGLAFNICYGAFLVDGLGFKNLGDIGFTTAMNIFTPLVPGVFITSWYIVFPVLCAAFYGLLVLYEKFLLPKIQTKKNDGLK